MSTTTIAHPLTEDNSMSYTLTETPLTCAEAVLMRHYPGQPWLFYRHLVDGILKDNRPDRTTLEHDVIMAYRKREAEWRAARREGTGN